MVDLYQSLSIKTIYLSQEYRKISVRFLVLKIIYLLYFIQKYMGRIKLPIKK